MNEISVDFAALVLVQIAFEKNLINSFQRMHSV